MLLMDTCVLLWLAGKQDEFSDQAKTAIQSHAPHLFVSAISAFEIGVKHQKGKILLPLPPEQWIELALKNHGITMIPIDWKTALLSTRLPPLHNDPCDRMIIATAIGSNLPILTPDHAIAGYPGITAIW